MHKRKAAVLQDTLCYCICVWNAVFAYILTCTGMLMKSTRRTLSSGEKQSTCVMTTSISPLEKWEGSGTQISQAIPEEVEMFLFLKGIMNPWGSHIKEVWKEIRGQNPLVCKHFLDKLLLNRARLKKYRFETTLLSSFICHLLDNFVLCKPAICKPLNRRTVVPYRENIFNGFSIFTVSLVV